MEMEGWGNLAQQLDRGLGPVLLPGRHLRGPRPPSPAQRAALLAVRESAARRPVSITTKGLSLTSAPADMRGGMQRIGDEGGGGGRVGGTGDS